MPPFIIDPPLLNSSNPWATTLEDLRELYECPHTGAVTTRTSLLDGFKQDSKHHSHIFFNISQHDPTRTSDKDTNNASLNTYGYSPIPFNEYLGFIKQISEEHGGKAQKPFIISVTGTVEEVTKCYHGVFLLQQEVSMRLAMEINLSCPNIPDKPPPAYDAASLTEYLKPLSMYSPGSFPPVGIKTPPYTYANQFKTLVDTLGSIRGINSASPISFITATNTLGNALVLSGSLDGLGSDGIGDSAFREACPSYDGSGLGGMAGTPLHPLALGNVSQLTQRLKKHVATAHIKVIGVGGVSDADGVCRMKHVGATAVGVGTALGLKGVAVFEEIIKGLEGKGDVAPAQIR